MPSWGKDGRGAMGRSAIFVRAGISLYGASVRPTGVWTGRHNAAPDEMSQQPGFQSGSLAVTVGTPTSEAGGT
jgi:hypothetical protein